MLLHCRCRHALTEQAVAQAARVVGQQELAGLRIEERAVMPRTVLLLAVRLFKRATK
jgi:hypothetical protein